MKIPLSCRLYGILDLGYVKPAEAAAMAARMLSGGVGIVQLRAKNYGDNVIRPVADAVLPLCHKAGVPLILNDHPHLAAATGADGVHVGQDDMPVAEARKIVGPDAIVGLSTHSLAQALASEDSAPDYIGFGPLFATPTKPDYRAIGLEDISEVHRRIARPIFCIGGIKRENLHQVIAAGARRAVIVSGILQAPDPADYCRDCLAILG